MNPSRHARSAPAAAVPVRFAPGGREAWFAVAGWLVLLVLAAIAVYWSTARFTAITWWASETYAHGMIIFPLTGWMIWSRRHEILPLSPEPSWLGVLAVLLLSLGWLPGHLADAWIVQQTALILFVPALVVALIGLRAARAMAFPLAYLMFAIPAGESLVPPLIDFTAWFSVEALNLSGVPVYREGRFLAVPNGNFEVADACSGVRYLIASLALGAMYAYLNYRSAWRRLIFIALAAIVPVIANGLRAYAIIMIAHLSDMKYAVGVDHLIFGWVFFGLVMFFLFWLGSFWMDTSDSTVSTAVEPRPPAAGIRGRIAAFALLSLIALVAGRGIAWWLEHSPGAPVAFTFQAPPAQGGWSGPEAAVDGLWEPQLVGRPLQNQRRYTRGEENVDVHWAVYIRQGVDNELINENNRVVRAGYWRELGEDARELVTADGRTLAVRELRVRGRHRERVIWYWYVVDGHATVNPFLAKALEAWQRLRGRQGAALIAVATDYDLRPEAARERLRTFLSTMRPALEASAHVP